MSFHARNNPDDPLVQQKKSFIESNGLVVWRFHDHWHAQKPDGIIPRNGHRAGLGEVSGSRQRPPVPPA